MTKEEFIDLIRGGTQGAHCRAAFRVLEIFEGSQSFELKIGGETEAKKNYDLYRMRRERLLSSGGRLPVGIDETINSLRNCGSELLVGGYVKDRETLVYFWYDSSLKLEGCIVMEH